MSTPTAYAIVTTYQDYEYIIASPLCHHCANDPAIARELTTNPVRVVPIVCRVPNRAESCDYCAHVLITDTDAKTGEDWRGNNWDYATDARP